MIHTLGEGFSIVTETEAGVNYTMVHNGYAQLIVERPTSFPPMGVSQWTDSQYSHMTFSFPPPFG